MRSRLIAGTVFAAGAWHAAAQATHPLWPPTPGCVEFNRRVVSEIENGRLAIAEAALSNTLAGTETPHDDSCTWLILQNAASVAHLQGRLLAAERLARRSLRIVDGLLPATDPRRLRSMQLIWSIQSQLGKRAEARRTLEEMQQLRLESPQDRAMVHGATAIGLQTEGDFVQSEIQFRAALSATEEAGRGRSADQASLLGSLGSLYLAQKRFVEADLTMSHALVLLKSAPDAVAFDYIRLLQARAALHVGQKQWVLAEEDLRSATKLADGSMLDPAQIKDLLDSHAYVLRKAHRRAEARTIEARSAKIRDVLPGNSLLDVTELRSEGRARNRR